MIVYHGTSSRNLDSILAGGLTPNVDSSNWEGSYRYHKTTKKLVYVTTRDPVHFSINSCWDGTDGIIFKLDVDEKNLCPDVDFLGMVRRELVKRGLKPPVVSLDNIEDGLIAAREHGVLSLQKMGLAAHLGVIEKERILSHARISYRARHSMLDLHLQEHVGQLSPDLFFNEEEFRKRKHIDPLGITFGS